jgi:hypothetical protein
MKKNNKQISIKKAKRNKKNVKRIKNKELKEHYLLKYLRRQQTINQIVGEEKAKELPKPVVDGLTAEVGDK